MKDQRGGGRPPRLYMHSKLRDGKIVYLYEYADRGEALEAPG